MKFAIIAAGEGSRLQKEGIVPPKPLLPLQGTPMIDRLIETFDSVGCDAGIVVSVRGDANGPVAQHLQSKALERKTKGLSPLTIVCGNPPDSMHSFAMLREAIGNEPFCLTTVDTVFSHYDFRRYIAAFQEALRNGLDGLMAVTDFIHDEKPLHVQTDAEMNITAFLDDRPAAQRRFISGGIYALSPAVFPILEECLRTGVHRMRNFQRALIGRGLRLRAYAFSKIIDVDHTDDIPLAQTFLSQCDRVLCLSRAPHYSPANTDMPIIRAVAERLYRKGLTADIICEDDFITSPETYRNCRCIVSMARGPKTLQALAALHDEGIHTLNAPQGVATCNTRCQLADLMHRLAIPTPAHTSVILSTSINITRAIDTLPATHYPMWVKSGDQPVTSAADVTYVETPSQLSTVLNQMHRTAATHVLLESHVEGSHVKFYAVGSHFFHLCYPEAEGLQPKFAINTHNDAALQTPIDKQALQADVCRLADALGVPVCGGDAIVRPNGSYAIIDFNDWPSFRPCIDEAADAIIRTIEQQL